MSVSVLAQNEADIPRQPLSFNEASTVKLEFWVKNRPNFVGRELLPIRGGQTLDQARRMSTISYIGLSTKCNNGCE